MTTKETPTKQKTLLNRAVRVGLQLGMIGPLVYGLALRARGAEHLTTYFAFWSSVLLVPVCFALFLFSQRHAPRRGGVCARQTALVATLALITISGYVTHWPLTVSFAVSRPALERLADRVERGEAVTFPARAGFFTIYDADPNAWRNNVVLFSSRNGSIGLARRRETARNEPQFVSCYGDYLSERWCTSLD